MSRKTKDYQSAKLAHSPKEALVLARQLFRQGLFHVGRTELPNELSELGYPGDELMREALSTAFAEAHADFFQTDPNPRGRPAYIFVWQSKFFRKRIYLKFKLEGTRKKPVLWVYSCHKAHF